MIITASICTYNRSHILTKAIESVLSQDFPSTDYELLIVDNASTDRTEEVVKSHISSHPHKNIRYIQEPKLGLSNARNTAWKNAKSKYVAYLDDDAKASISWLKSFVEVLKRHPQAAACGGKVIVNWNGKSSAPKWIPEKYLVLYGGFNLGNRIKQHNYAPGGNSAWKVDVLKKMGGFSTRLGRKGNDAGGCEESLLNRLLLKNGYELYYTPRALMYHNIEKKRLTRRWLYKRCFWQQISGTRWVAEERGISKKSVLIKNILDESRNLAKDIKKNPKVLFSDKKKKGVELRCKLVSQLGRIRGALELLVIV